MTEVWYRNAILYALDVESFLDSHGDGVGDFRGLTRRLDYLSGLGITCLWLRIHAANRRSPAEAAERARVTGPFPYSDQEETPSWRP